MVTASNHRFRAMIIALVTPQWSGTVGGPSNYIAALQRELRKLGNTVYVLTGDSGPEAIHIRGGTPSRDWRLFRELRRIRPDIVHLHGRVHLIPAAVFCRWFLPRTRVVFTFHTQPYVGPFIPGFIGKPDYSPLSRRIAAFLLRQCDVVTTVSKSIVENLNSRYSLGIARFEVIPSGGYPEPRDPVEAKQFKTSQKLDGHFPILASVGVFTWDWKVRGHQLCIDAVAHLTAKYPGVTLVVAGDGQFGTYLREYARERGVEQNVRFLGNLENTAALLGAADVYLHMALNEGCSLALVEAMLAGKPIVAARRGGNPEILEDGISARLVEPDGQALAVAIAEMLDDQGERLRLARNALAKATEFMTWPIVARRYVATYAEASALADAR